MGEPSTLTDKPTLLMRLVLGLATAATTLFAGGPVILLLMVGLFASAALSLAHMGALEPATFESAHNYGLAGLLAFFVAAVGYRVARRDAKGLLGAMSRHPVITAAITLPLLSLVVVGAEWDRGELPKLSGALIVDDLYFFALGVMMLMVITVLLVARGVYRWAVAERYRAGLITGAQVTVLALLLIGAHYTTRLLTPSPAPPPDISASDGWRNDVVAAGQVTTGIEAERRLLVGVDAILEPWRRGQPAPAALTPAPSADDDIRACIEQLVLEVVQVQRSIESRFRFSEDDAHDIVRDALLNVCNAHVRKRYERLGAVFQTAAERRAITWAYRRHRQCEIDMGWPICAPAVDDVVRFQQEDAILDGALCQEDPMTQQIILLHVQEELHFPEIGTRLGLTGDAARTKYNNALRRMRKRLADLCDF